jgi:PAS domain S-box-containing protein
METRGDGLKSIGAIGPLLDAMLDAVIVIDAAGDIVAWNPMAENVFGWTAEEAIGGPMDALIVPLRHRAGHLQGMYRYRATGEGQVLNRRIEISAIDKAGREFPIELAIVPMEGAGGRYFIGFLRDIEARHAASARLAVSEESLRLATQAGEIGTWDLDIASNVLTWSDRTRAMFGISPGLPVSLDDFYAGLHPDDHPSVAAAFGAALDPRIRARYDVQYRTIGKEDRIVRWVAAKGHALFDDQGRCIRTMGTVTDMTAHKLTEARQSFMLRLTDLFRGPDTVAALQDASALMGEFFGVARVGYGHLDPVEDMFDYDVCWTDGDVPPLLGRFPARLFGEKIVRKLGGGETVVVDDLFTDPISDEADTRATAARVDTRAILVVPFVRAGRLRTIVYLNDRVARPWSTDEVMFMEEVAERTRQVIARGEAEAALQQLNATLEMRVEERTADLHAAEAALRQSQKMEAVGQLTGGIAHDFNNLLQAITGSLELLQRRVRQGRVDDLDRLVGGAVASANRAAALTHRLLAFSRRQPLDPRPVAGNPLIESMEDLLRRTMGEHIILDFALAEDLWLTRCDTNQLESAILNLAINARDAMPNGGSLRIQTRNVELGVGDPLRDPDVAPGPFVAIGVWDSGSGMPADVLARAFEPFFTTKPIGQGTGLGLSMVYGFARQSEGFAHIASRPGEGTGVTLYLPRFDGDLPADDPVMVADIAASTDCGKSVLVVEDEAIVRRLIVEVLHDLGYRTIEADDGLSGLALLQSDVAIDLLITDIGLPGLNGRDLAEAARSVRAELGILFMTGYAEDAALAAGFLAPGMSMIIKPFTMDAFATRIGDIMAGGGPVG